MVHLQFYYLLLDVDVSIVIKVKKFFEESDS